MFPKCIKTASLANMTGLRGISKLVRRPGTWRICPPGAREHRRPHRSRTINLFAQVNYPFPNVKRYRLPLELKGALDPPYSINCRPRDTEQSTD